MNTSDEDATVARLVPEEVAAGHLPDGTSAVWMVRDDQMVIVPMEAGDR